MTNSSRAQILSSVRQALTNGSNPRPVDSKVRRAYRTTSNVLPGTPTVIDVLIDRLQDYRATVLTTTSSAIAATIHTALRDVSSVVVPAGLNDQVVEACGRSHRVIHVDEDAAPLTAADLDNVDAVVTAARVAIAITGTIVLDSAPDQGRRAITLVPDRHVIVLRAQQVVHTVPEAIARLDPTRPLTMISGPSATSDIELQRVEGVHGPRNLVVVIVL